MMSEGLPTYPDASRLWQVVDKHQVNILYTAPTAIRALMQQGDEPQPINQPAISALLGSVGEPINPEAWLWYHNVVGEGRWPIVDTWWQTEKGGILITPSLVLRTSSRGLPHAHSLAFNRPLSTMTATFSMAPAKVYWCFDPGPDRCGRYMEITNDSSKHIFRTIPGNISRAMAAVVMKTAITDHGTGWRCYQRIRPSYGYGRGRKRFSRS